MLTNSRREHFSLLAVEQYLKKGLREAQNPLLLEAAAQKAIVI